MIDIQGVSADVGGYYKLDEDKANAVMRPSKVTIIAPKASAEGACI